jgi:hypothetical protein
MAVIFGLAFKSEAAPLLDELSWAINESRLPNA